MDEPVAAQALDIAHRLDSAHDVFGILAADRRRRELGTPALTAGESVLETPP